MWKRNRLCLQLQLDKSHSHLSRSDTRTPGRHLGYGSLPIPWDSLTCGTYCVCFLRIKSMSMTSISMLAKANRGQFANSNAGCGGKQEHVMSLRRTGPSYRIFCFFNSLAISLTTPSIIVCADFGLNESLVPVQMSSPSAAVVA